MGPDAGAVCAAGIPKTKKINLYRHLVFMNQMPVLLCMFVFEASILQSFHLSLTMKKMPVLKKRNWRRDR